MIEMDRQCNDFCHIFPSDCCLLSDSQSIQGQTSESSLQGFKLKTTPEIKINCE